MPKKSELESVCDIMEEKIFKQYEKLSKGSYKNISKYINGAFNAKAFKKALDKFRKGSPKVVGSYKIHSSAPIGLSELNAIVCA